MALIAVTSPDGSPGATTAALGWTLAWEQKALLAECSPFGGTVMSGFFRSELGPEIAQRGLWNVNLAGIENGPEEARRALDEQVVALHEERERLLLPGLIDPFRATQLVASWPMLASLFKRLPYDVLVDVGPLGPQAPFPLLGAADLVVLVMRPTMVQTTAAVPRLDTLRRALGVGADLALCVIGSARSQVRDPLHYSVEAVRRRLGDFSLELTLAHDSKTAGRLSDGLPAARNIEVSPLMRDIRRTASMLRSHVTAQQLSLRAKDQPHELQGAMPAVGGA